MKNVTIYTGPYCNYCDAAKRLLTRNNVPYKEINVAEVDGAKEEMIKKSRPMIMKILIFRRGSSKVKRIHYIRE